MGRRCLESCLSGFYLEFGHHVIIFVALKVIIMADDFDTENKCLAFCSSKIFVSELSANEEPSYNELQNSKSFV